MSLSDPASDSTEWVPPGVDTLGPDLLAVLARLNRWATSHAKLDISAAQARLLAQIEQTGPVRTSDLARLDRSSQPTITAQLQRAEQEGWTLRTADPRDGRASLVELTDAGRGVLREVRRARAAALTPRLDELDQAERETLTLAIAVIERLIDSP